MRWTGRQPWCARTLGDVDEPERGWRPGAHILFELGDGQTVPCRIVNVTEDGVVQVVPERAVFIG